MAQEVSEAVHEQRVAELRRRWNVYRDGEITAKVIRRRWEDPDDPLVRDPEPLPDVAEPGGKAERLEVDEPRAKTTIAESIGALIRSTGVGEKELMGARLTHLQALRIDLLRQRALRQDLLDNAEAWGSIGPGGIEIVPEEVKLSIKVLTYSIEAVEEEIADLKNYVSEENTGGRNE